MSKRFIERQHDAYEDRDVMQQTQALREEERNEAEDCARELKDKRDAKFERNAHHPPKK